MNYYKEGMPADFFENLQIAKDYGENCKWVVIQNNRKRKVRVEYNPKPYYFICLRRPDGKAQQYQLARVIWTNFLHREIPAGYVIDHKDEDSMNNHPDNLQCIPAGENVRKSWKIKKFKKN